MPTDMTWGWHLHFPLNCMLDTLTVQQILHSLLCQIKSRLYPSTYQVCVSSVGFQYHLPHSSFKNHGIITCLLWISFFVHFPVLHKSLGSNTLQSNSSKYHQPTPSQPSTPCIFFQSSMHKLSSTTYSLWIWFLQLLNQMSWMHCYPDLTDRPCKNY